MDVDGAKVHREKGICFLGFAGGVLTAVAQIIVFYVRFGRWNTESPFVDYFFFFLAGTLGRWIRIKAMSRPPRGCYDVFMEPVSMPTQNR